MDFFRGIGDWFRGVFGRDDDEEKKRRQSRQQQTPRAQRQSEPVRSPAQLFGQNQQTQKQQTVDTPQTEVPQLFQTQVQEGLSTPRSLRPEARPNATQQIEDAAQKLASGSPGTPYSPEVIRAAQPRVQQIKQQQQHQRQISKPSVDEYRMLSPNQQRNYEQRLKEYRDTISPTTAQGAAEIRRINEALAQLQGSGARGTDAATLVRGLASGATEAIQGGVTNILGNQLQSIYSAATGQRVGMLRTPQDIERANQLYRSGEIDYDTLVRAFRASPELFNVNNDWKIERDGGIKRTEGVLDSTAQFARQFGQAGSTVAEFLPFGAASSAATRLGRFGSRFLQGGALNTGLSLGGNVLDTASSATAQDVAQDAAISFLFGGLIEGVTGNARPRNIDLTSAAQTRRVAISRAKQADPSLTDAQAAELVDEAASQLANRQRGETNRGNLQIEDTENADLQRIINDEGLPAFERQRARDELARRQREAARAELADPSNESSLEFRRRMQAEAERIEQRMNDYINSNPDLTPQQIEAIQIAARQRLEEVIRSMQQNRQTAQDMVEEQINEQAENIAAQAGRAQELADEQAASVAPRTGDRVPEEGASPEVTANDAYRDVVERELYGDAPTFQERDGLSWNERFSPERQLRERVTRPLEEMANRGIAAAQTARNPLVRGVGRLFTGFTSEAGRSADQLAARRQLGGAIGSGRLNRETIGNLGKEMSEESKTKVWATLDPEQAGRAGINVDQLTPEELALQTKLKTLVDNTTAEMLRRGFITPEQAANQSYIKRAYEFFENNPDLKRFEGGMRTNLLDQTKGRKEVSDQMIEQAITDPTYLVGKKTAEAEALFAMQDYGNFLSREGIAIDAPRPGYTQLPDSPVFGEAAGKYVPHSFSEDFTGFTYNLKFVQAVNDVFQIYDRWNVRQAKKALLTVFNPAVRVGNQVTNRVIFSGLGGINPVSFNLKMRQVPGMIKQNDQLYREAVAEGLVGIDITQAEFFARHMGEVTGDDNLFKRASKYLQDTYSGADDQARIAAYSIYRERGYSPAEAARMTQRQFQDYKSVGFFYELASRTPIIGNAFVRFAGDAMRVAKNTALDRPLTAASMMMTWGALTNAMSIASGESEFQSDNPIQNAADLFTGATKSQEQIDRESRFGAARIPFANISLTLQTPWGEINAARFMPWHALNNIDSGLSGMLPFESSPITFEDGKLGLDSGGINDPLLGQFVQLGIDRDFRGRSISDPDNNEAGDKYALDPATPAQEWGNRARFLLGNNLPIGNELDALASTGALDFMPLPGDRDLSELTGGRDRFGKTRSVPQSIARLFGIKVEEYGDEQIEDLRGRNRYYEDLDKINQELEGMTPSEQEAWRRLSGYYRLRDQVENRFEPGTTRDRKAPVYEFAEDKWKDYAANPRLYELMVQKKQQDAARDGTPIQPEFDERLSASFRRQLIQNKMVAPGDDAELDQRMYNSPEWDYYQELRNRYRQAAGDYYGESEFEGDELVKHQDEPFPTKSDVYKAYTDAYAAYADGRLPAKPEFTDEVKAAREQYQKATFDWTNNARRARGLPPITWDVWNNPTFGFDTSPSGFGFGGGGSRRPADVNTLGRLTDFSSAVTGDTARKIQADEMENLEAIFRAVMAGSRQNRARPRLGASSRGR